MDVSFETSFESLCVLRYAVDFYLCDLRKSFKYYSNPDSYFAQNLGVSEFMARRSELEYKISILEDLSFLLADTIGMYLIDIQDHWNWIGSAPDPDIGYYFWV